MDRDNVNRMETDAPPVNPQEELQTARDDDRDGGMIGKRAGRSGMRRPAGPADGISGRGLVGNCEAPGGFGERRERERARSGPS